MAWFPNAGASLRVPRDPKITFMTVDRVLSLALLLIKKSEGGADSYEQLESLIYSCLIYDQYANEWVQANNLTGINQRESWLRLAQLPELNEQDRSHLSHRYQSKIVGNVKLFLPVISHDPTRRPNPSPQRYADQSTQEVELKQLSLEEFIEVAYTVRCNLLHGWYDVTNDSHAQTVICTGLRFSLLVRWMVQNTQFQ
ncbi:MAG: hypothetical protein HUJ26_04555 [Planctomycetaceae bacterium]|nr:hypothetical protein [Planctomycetaceae bacterium]